MFARVELARSRGPPSLRLPNATRPPFPFPPSPPPHTHTRNNDQVREGRAHASRPAKVRGGARGAAFDEEFYLVVDDVERQMLTIKVRRAL